MGNPTFSADKLWGHRYVVEYVPDWEAGNSKTVSGDPTTILTPPSGCKKVQLYSNADILVRVDGRPADALSQLVPGNTVIVLEVTENVPVTAVCVGGQAVVYAIPRFRKAILPLDRRSR